MSYSTRKNIFRGKRLLSVILCLVMTTTAFSVIAAPSNNQNQSYETTDQLQYTFSFLEPSVQQKRATDTTLYSTVQMPGCLGLGKQEGAPTLPVKFIQLLLPSRTTVESVSVSGDLVEINVQGIDLTSQPIIPYQNEIPLNSPLPDQIVINTEVYHSNALYPLEKSGAYHVGYSRGYAILDLSLNPVQYSPHNGQLFYYPELTVTISLQENQNENTLYRDNPADEAWVKTLVSNPEITSTYTDRATMEYPGGLCDPSDSYEYVIITTTQNGLDYWDTSSSTPNNWESLMVHHAGDGLSSTVVTVQDINDCTDYHNSIPLFNDQPAHIREFCKDAYEDWGTQYVLIGGDSDTIAARQLYYDYEGNVDSDIYWSNLDNNFNTDSDNRWGEEGDLGFDLYTELFIGRIVCDEPQDVSNWLTKNFFYADSTDYEYLDNAAFYGGNSGWSTQGDDFVDFGAVKTTTNWLGPQPGAHGAYPTWLGMQYGFETWNLVNPGNMYNMSVKWSDAPSPNPGWQSGNAILGLKNAINDNQVTLLSAFAHADPHMSCDVEDTEWASQYHNTQPFFVTDMGCHCGDFNDGDGILEVMLFNSDTYLAFACTYNTGYGWGSFDDTNSSSALQMKSFWDYFFDATNNSQSQSEWQLGKGHAWSKDVMAPTINWTYSSAPGSWRGIIESCLLFGDPAQQIKTPSPSDPPAQPIKPSGVEQGIWNQQYSYTSRATDPNNDQVYYLFDWDDGSNSGWIGPYPSGQIGSATHTWTELGVYTIQVKARDVWGAGSIWSEPLIVTITDNMPPEIPEVTGPAEGKPGNQYLFNMQTDDPQGDNIYYFVDWGDTTTTEWLGPYLSGTQIHLIHAWTQEGTYTVKVKAKDSMNSESDWGVLDIVMPTTFTPGNHFLQWLFENFPNAFPLLRHLMGYA